MSAQPTVSISPAVISLSDINLLCPSPYGPKSETPGSSPIFATPVAE